MISTTHVNLVDVQKRCDQAGFSRDHPIRYLLCEMAESAIAQEQAINEIKVSIEVFVASLAVHTEAAKVFKQKLAKIERRFDNTDMTSFGEPS